MGPLIAISGHALAKRVNNFRALRATVPIDPDDLAALRIERHVAAGSNPGVENSARKVGKNRSPQRPIPPILEGKIERVVKTSDATIGLGVCQKNQVFVLYSRGGVPPADSKPRPAGFRGVGSGR